MFIKIDKYNTCFGVNAGLNATGEGVYIGFGAGSRASGGEVCIGNNTGIFGGNNSITIGKNAARYTESSNRIAIGAYSHLYGSSSRSVFLGNYSGYSATKAVNGYENIFIGSSSCSYHANSDFNGYRNVFLGAYSAQESEGQVMNVFNSIGIGYKVATTKSNQVVLGNDNITETLLKGNIGISLTNPSEKLHIGIGNFLIDQGNIQLNSGNISASGDITSGSLLKGIHTSRGGNVLPDGSYVIATGGSQDGKIIIEDGVVIGVVPFMP